MFSVFCSPRLEPTQNVMETQWKHNRMETQKRHGMETQKRHLKYYFDTKPMKKQLTSIVLSCE